MHSSNSTISARNMRPGLFLAIVTGAQWLARKMNERRNCNALMELSDEQLKDIGLSRGQTESDVHVYSRC
ncbi:DUF1127 domain-containing protein [Rhizobium leguminosarum]|uniref:DUF1127 domain-containing protein n=1 Tax=Rhizobium leguminosarum TaxID=384 RepID=UPI001C92A9C8|nr:DUF1127 domain-containing protein [Rhizobium leguminosarum]MBY2909633.1 DUF1127 domain-containing protein [Rhizobium leguminosarum]MBY2913482.1 DUF1127 domain-containing protein [Rhizobium leguminosarum]MBY2949864.1 DUF1127 domain-containing protein [Rhizobium leguminosarum]MBY2969019.1 DUF1127 domain-containing protein [Rhizobium leguminosarum]MBY2976393.1 DUF1127 domain-containing protein [Rhizobium leguminosarum]